MEIREIAASDVKKALNLAKKVFEQYNADDYSKQGRQEFYKYIKVRTVKKRIGQGSLQLFGCYGEKLLGMGALTDKKHISLLFVDQTFHKKGVGGALVEAMLERAGESVTVNSSLYAAEFYKKLGFKETNGVKEVNGIIFIPMERANLNDNKKH